MVRQSFERSTMVSMDLLTDGPSCPGSIPSIHELFSVEIVDVAEVNQHHCLEESGQWLENVDLTHLALTSGKLEVQKRFPKIGLFSHQSMKV